MSLKVTLESDDMWSPHLGFTFDRFRVSSVARNVLLLVFSMVRRFPSLKHINNKLQYENET